MHQAMSFPVKLCGVASVDAWSSYRRGIFQEMKNCGAASVQILPSAPFPNWFSHGSLKVPNTGWVAEMITDLTVAEGPTKSVVG